MAEEKTNLERFMRYWPLMLFLFGQFVGAVAWATSIKGDMERVKQDESHTQQEVEEIKKITAQIPFINEKVNDIKTEQTQMKNILARIEAKL